MIRRPPRSTLSSSSAASDVYKRQVEQRDASGAVRVVLDLSDLGRDTVLVVPLEVNEAIGLLVATADVTGRDPALVVATAGLRLRRHQGLLRRGARHLDEVCDARATTNRCRRLVLTNTHDLCSSLLVRPERTGRCGRRRPRSR